MRTGWNVWVLALRGIWTRGVSKAGGEVKSKELGEELPSS